MQKKSLNSDSEDGSIDKVPDGGLAAWLVVFGAWCSSFCSFGWLNSVGVFQDYYERELLPQYSPSTIAWIPSLQIFFMLEMGPIVCKLFDMECTVLSGEPILPTPSYATYIRGALGKITLDHYASYSSLETGVSTRSLASFNITTATVVKAAWSTVLANTTGKTDVVFGHLISGRNVGTVPGIESIVGPCLNVVPEIIGKCTDWNDDGANGFSTVVQHQSMLQTGSLAIGGNTYEVGAMASQEDTADFSIITTPQDANSTEVCLFYARGGAIDTALAEQMFDSLCSTITAFSENPNISIII
ncbi:hypothetical protein B0J13DRAFT_614645 [Dactylonectria estremocensis]|uniref:Condensation domain-containing protein n=1 Tax=Dactylonectria estremocensis TaxID=1079267 RepID=A0A9P9FHW3_9HYPO|nr:hypothetical protein B0J13DRAFT_614645 [Dactylonectria estremocensis]